MARDTDGDVREILVFDEMVKETDSAWLIEFDRKRVFLPKSQVDIDMEDNTVEVPMWLIKEKGLEAFIDG